MLRPFAYLMLVAFVSGEHTLTFDDTWAKLGEPFVLNCLASEIIEDPLNCHWSTPYGSNVLIPKTGYSKENDRLIGQINSNGCALNISTTEAKDFGNWTCTMFIGSKGEEAEATAELKKANMPQEVRLENSIGKNNKSHEFRCVVAITEPEPKFSWYIGEELMIDTTVKTETNENEIIQILSFIPQPDHSNQTLKCQIDFVAHGFTEKFDDTVALPKLTVDEYAELIEEKEKEIDAIFSSPNITTIVIVVLFGILGLGLTIFVLCRVKSVCKSSRKTEVDAEGGEKETETEEATEKLDLPEESTEKTDLTKEERESLNEAAKASFSERFATFFRFNRSFNLDNQTTSEEIKGDGDLNTPEVVVEDNKKTTEEEPMVEGGKPEEKNTQNFRFRNFFSKMFRPRDVVADKKGEEPVVKMTDCKDEVEPENKPEATEQIQPEDKLEKPDVEEKEPTPNTSF